MYDIDAFRRTYPEYFNIQVTLWDIAVGLLFFIMPFLVTYLYIRYFESRAVSFVRARVVPFIRFKLRLDKLIGFVDRVLKMEISGILKSKF